MTKYKGSVKEFDENWKKSSESSFEYWTRKEPINQTQYSFKNLWSLFKEIIRINQIVGKEVIEIGSGRGTMSSYFADNGYKVHLLDSSKKAIEISKKIFKKNGHQATFTHSVLEKFKIDKKFDILFSIGLMEHYKNIKDPLLLQTKLLKKNGLFLAYVVPDYKLQNVQKDYLFVNKILEALFKSEKSKNYKSDVYRNTLSSKYYKKILKTELKNISVYGVYPLPMISYSTSFPFTILNEKIEKIILIEFNRILKNRKNNKFFHPWLCKEGYGQAFLIWGKKK